MAWRPAISATYEVWRATFVPLLLALATLVMAGVAWTGCVTVGAWVVCGAGVCSAVLFTGVAAGAGAGVFAVSMDFDDLFDVVFFIDDMARSPRCSTLGVSSSRSVKPDPPNSVCA